MVMSRLEGGPEDGEEVEVEAPPFPVLHRRFGDRIERYELADEESADGMLRWRHAGSERFEAPDGG